MNLRRLLLTPILAVMICSVLTSVAQGSKESGQSRGQVDYSFLFPIGSSDLDMSFQDNGGQFNRMIISLGSMTMDRRMRVDRIVIRASSSPDGSALVNERLWTKRADAIRNSITSVYPELWNRIHVLPRGENWVGLYEAVLEDQKMPNRMQAADIIAMSNSIDTRKYFLRQLDNGATWDYIARNILPTLRMASVTIFSSPIEPIEEKKTEKEVVLVPFIITSDSELTAVDPFALHSVLRDTVVVRDTLKEFNPMTKDSVDTSLASSAKYSIGTKYSSAESKELTPGMSIKTNLLYLLGLQANLETEFYFGRRWSLNLEAQVAWWSLPKQHMHYRYANFSPEIRFWFRKNGSFTGGYFGLAVGAGLYDLSMGQARNNYEGYQGEFGVVSLTYGRMWHIKNNFYIEAGLGVGYLVTEYRRYQHLDTHNVYQSTERLQTFFPTKLKVNLVWRLGNGNRKR